MKRRSFLKLAGAASVMPEVLTMRPKGSELRKFSQWSYKRFGQDYTVKKDGMTLKHGRYLSEKYTGVTIAVTTCPADWEFGDYHEKKGWLFVVGGKVLVKRS